MASCKNNIWPVPFDGVCLVARGTKLKQKSAQFVFLYTFNMRLLIINICIYNFKNTTGNTFLATFFEMCINFKVKSYLCRLFRKVKYVTKKK
jgi:hypothetical protein